MDEVACPAEIDLGAFSAAMSRVLRDLDGEDFPFRLFDALSCVVPVELASCYVYSGRAKPLHLGDTFKSKAARAGQENFLNTTYVLNPVYNAYLRGVRGGVYRIGELAPDSYFESDHYKELKVKILESEEIGYITDGWPRGMEELVFAIELPEGEMGEISLLRAIRSGGFAEAHIEALRAIEPLIVEAFRLFWARRKTRQTVGPQDTAIDEAFARFGGDCLSPREREVAQLILRGHSTHSIGDQLGITDATVKSHRKNLYGKLEIATQYELFSLFIQSLELKAA
jgi:DNA-binding CsgD family transcriptional regulator